MGSLSCATGQLLVRDGAGSTDGLPYCIDAQRTLTEDTERTHIYGFTYKRPVNWYDANDFCMSKGARLSYAAELTAASRIGGFDIGGAKWEVAEWTLDFLQMNSYIERGLVYVGESLTYQAPAYIASGVGARCVYPPITQ